MAEIRYSHPMFPRLVPQNGWRGGRMADTDVLSLEDAARFASQHAGVEITVSDFLRAAGRGEIRLAAIVHQRGRMASLDGSVLFNKGQPDENVIPAGSIPTLPLTACQHLAATGRASWRTYDGFKQAGGEFLRYTKGALVEGEPDFETVPTDCRVTGNDVHALADAYLAPEPPPVLAESSPEAGPDFDQLATREQLIAAFESFTGMDMSWFDNLNDTPALLAARKRKGQGGHGHIVEPLFCPFEVMQWLIDPKRRKGRPMLEATGWRMLKAHFSAVYAEHESYDPNAD